MSALLALLDSGPSGPTMNMDFMGGDFPAALSWARASTASRCNTAAMLEMMGNNVGRLDCNPSTAKSNYIWNSVGNGVGVNQAPTWWTPNGNGASGVLISYQGSGNDGEPYTTVTISGTASASGSLVFDVSGFTQIPAFNGQDWTYAVGLQVTSGTPLSCALTMVMRNAANAVIGALYDTYAPLTTGLVRRSFSATLNNADTVYVVPRLTFTFAAGQVVNMSFRVYALSLIHI